MLRTIEESSQDLSVSRPLARVPWAIAVDGVDGVYVWIDALTNYLTTSESRSFDQVMHVFGKDIAKFHCYFYPCLLLALRCFWGRLCRREEAARSHDLPRALDRERRENEQEQGKLRAAAVAAPVRKLLAALRCRLTESCFAGIC